MAHVEGTGGEAARLLKESTRKHPPVSVARALVQVVFDQVPVCLLNTRPEPITIYAGTEIATLERAEVLSERIQSVEDGGAQPEAGIDSQKLELLSALVEESGDELGAEEKQKFLDLLWAYADVFACSTSDLG